MNKPLAGARILILGGFGRVGLEVARYLRENTDAHLVLAGRKERTMPSWMAASPERPVSVQSVDVHDARALSAACMHADLVVSCVGPSGKVGDRVASACKRTSVPLVDAGGYDPLLRSLEKAETNAPTRVPLVINVGLLPGLSGLFPHWLIETCGAGRVVEQLDLHYVGRDAWTYNSAWDIVHSLGGFGDDKGFCYLRDQRVVRVPMRQASCKAAFPEPIGTVSTMLIYAEEIARLARRHGIGLARVYGANAGPRAAMVCLLAKMLRWHRSERGIDRGARWLVRASARDMRKLAPVYGIRAELRYQDGTSDCASLALDDTYRATGTVIGIAARCLLEDAAPGPGVFMLHEAVAAGTLVQRLEQQGLARIERQSPEAAAMEGASA